MWRQYEGYRNRPKPPESEGERLARERGINTWPWQRIIGVEHVPYVAPPSGLRMTRNGHPWRPPTHETLETLACYHVHRLFGWYDFNVHSGLVTTGYDEAGHRRCRQCAIDRFESEARWAAEHGLPRP